MNADEEDQVVFTMKGRPLAWNSDTGQISSSQHTVTRLGTSNKTVLMFTGDQSSCVKAPIPAGAIPCDPRNDAEGVRIWFRGDGRIYTFFMTDEKQCSWQKSFATKHATNDFREVTIFFPELEPTSDHTSQDERKRKFCLGQMTELGILYYADSVPNESLHQDKFELHIMSIEPASIDGYEM